jgi:ribonuclease HI/endonuclease/exonuclease/phosphatase family metal-dependent hydrolase
MDYNLRYRTPAVSTYDRGDGNVGGRLDPAGYPGVTRCAITEGIGSLNIQTNRNRVHPSVSGDTLAPFNRRWNLSRASGDTEAHADDPEVNSEAGTNPWGIVATAGSPRIENEAEAQPGSGNHRSDDHRDYENESSDSSSTLTEITADISITTEKTWTIEGDFEHRYNEEFQSKIEEIRVATVNIRGRYKRDGSRKIDKLQIVIEQMRIKNIGILAIQETHTKREEQENLEDRYPGMNFELSGNSTKANGVMIITQKKDAKIDKDKTKEYVQGRMLEANVNTKHGQQVKILNVYAPNKEIEKIEYYKTKIETEQDERRIVLGDFNMCEENMDRAPQTIEESKRVRDTWLNMKRELNLIDGWRVHYPEELRFSFKQDNNRGTENILARIDRIYNTENMSTQVKDWKIEEHLCSDHAIVTCVIKPCKNYKLAKPRWRIQNDIMREGTFRKQFIKATTKMNEEMKEYTRATERVKNSREKEKKIETIRQKKNPQTIWREYKKYIQKAAKITQRTKQLNLNKESKKIEKELGKINDVENEENRERIIELKERQTKIIEKRQGKLKDAKRLNWKTMGEQCTKYYFNLRKPKKDATIIESLKDNEGITREKPKELTAIAREYHKNLQSKPEMTRERKKAIKEILSNIETTIESEEQTELEETLKLDDIFSALKQCKNGKSPGEDGLTYEFWKWAHKTAMEYNEEEQKDISPMRNMKEYLRDVEEYGPISEDFAKGIMFPIYKKGDPEDIKSYRPITLLNTDYKLYTRTIAHKLTKTCEKIIHTDQAGFMPGRSIYNHTRLINIIEEACELEEINGYILALDQEKAYDRIDQEYLWNTMRAFKIPEITITRLKRIYESARTQVMINGHKGDSFRVERGTRQGDPMSCIIYNIAIEPLAITLRASNLKGIRFSEDIERVLTTIYADDTAITLSEDDDIKEVRKILETFCKASTAKFNETKEEIMPVGTTAFKENFVETRKMRCGYRIPMNIKIVTAEQPMRMLGAWHGDKGKAEDQWKRILEKQEQIMELWAKTRPTFRARVLLLKALVQSRAMYLAMVNGMPKDVEAKMTKQMSNFMWMGRKPQMTWEQLSQPIKNGGMNAPSIKHRNEAIDIMWMKNMLQEPKPTWAKIGLYLIGKYNKVKDIDTREWPIQKKETEQQKLPKILRKIIRIAKRTNLGISPALPTERLRKDMPGLYHIGNNQQTNRELTCLAKRHKVRTIEDLENIIRKDINELEKDKNKEGEKCKTGRKCKQKATNIVESLPTKWKPGEGNPRDNLNHTPRRKKRNEQTNYKKEEVSFNPDTYSTNEKWKELRIFRKGSTQTWPTRTQREEQGLISHIGPRPPNETPRKEQGIRNYRSARNVQEVEVYTDGATFRNGATNAEGGIGVWHSENNARNKKLKLKVDNPNNQKAELAAILVALRQNKDRPIIIITDSETAVDGILKQIRKWEDLGWHRIENKEYYRAILSELRQRKYESKIKWIKGHNGTRGNEEADKLADEGMNTEEEFTEKDLERNENFLEDGIRLHKITMKQAYEAIIDRSSKNEWKRTKRAKGISKMLEEFEEKTTYGPTEEMMNTTTWRLNLPNNVKDFLWKIQRNMTKCGPIFLQWGGEWTEKARCRCGEIESIKHIIMECPRGEQRTIWKTARKILRNAGCDTWDITWNNIVNIGCLPAALYLNDGDKRKEETIKTRIFTKVVANAAWNIWKIRCKRVIGEEKTKKKQLRKILKKELLDQLDLDWKAIGRIKNNKRRAKETKKYIETWQTTDTLSINEATNSVSWNEGTGE